MPRWTTCVKLLSFRKCFFGLAALLGLMTPHLSNAAASTDRTFSALHIGANTYRNVKVTTKNKDYVFILHSGGMTSIKVSDLSPDLLEKLGYAVAPAPKMQTTGTLTPQTSQAVHISQFKKIQTTLLQAWRGAGLVSEMLLSKLNLRRRILAAVMLLLMYLFFSYCCMLICEKTGKKPGILVWLPLVQLLPLLRAASMSPWWLITLFIPVLNFVSYGLWSSKIVQARWKTFPLMLMLLIPTTSWFAFLVLAFSEGAPKKQQKPCVEIMTLETA